MGKQKEGEIEKGMTSVRVAKQGKAELSEAARRENGRARE